jgi:hypothetical protein
MFQTVLPYFWRTKKRKKRTSWRTRKRTGRTLKKLYALIKKNVLFCTPKRTIWQHWFQIRSKKH